LELKKLYPNCDEFIKPLFRGRTIDKYYTHQDNQDYVIVINDDFALDKYPLVSEHLLKFKDKLEARAQFRR